MKKTAYKATIYNGHAHAERRVYEDNNGFRYIKINGCFYDLYFDLPKYWTVNVFYNPA